MLRENEGTLGQFFKENGYNTGMFGKWHMGDSYPYRPEDRGFTEVYRHGGGGSWADTRMFGIMLILTVAIFIMEKLFRQRVFVRMCFLNSEINLFAKV
jgi:hypothetical protein